MRLIDADRLKRQVEGRSWRAKGKFIELIDASATIKSQTVQVSFGVKHGRWIDMDDHVMCSCCGTTHYGADKNYCPNCGAMMDLEGEAHEQD